MTQPASIRLISGNWRVESFDWCTAHLDELAEKRSSAARAMFDKHEAEQKAKRAATPTAHPAKGKEAF